MGDLHEGVMPNGLQMAQDDHVVDCHDCGPLWLLSFLCLQQKYGDEHGADLEARYGGRRGELISDTRALYSECSCSKRTRPKAASRRLMSAAVQLPHTGHRCFAQRD